MRNRRFILFGLLGLGIDLTIYHVLLSKGVALDLANITAFFASTVVTYVYAVNARWSCAEARSESTGPGLRRHMTFLMIALLAFFLRGGLLANLVDLCHGSPRVAILPAIAGGAVVKYLGMRFFVFACDIQNVRPAGGWKVFALCVIGYTAVLRIVYLGMPELIYEEAYYWNYAMHLDVGYLDHPPMVAWTIWLTTKILGNTEFAVRIGAFVFWVVAAIFSFRLTSQLFDRSAALRAVVLLSILPFFWAIGSIMTPDSPLVACWAGALYFLKRALIDERPAAWWGVGLCVGLGMLSKYTIALLGPSTLCFFLVDRRSRRWLLRPEPYLSLLVAFVLFLPVIVWNLDHEWASFVFQGPRRFQDGLDFSMQEWIESVLVSLTPAGVAAMISIIKSKTPIRVAREETPETDAQRYHRFAMVFALVPLSVFFTFSLIRSSKVNWTGPLWLVVIPIMAYEMGPGAHEKISRFLSFARRAWTPTIVSALLIYSVAQYYLVSGFPGIPYPQGFSLLGWRNLAQQIERLAEETEIQTGDKPLVAGMDKNKIASGLAFYRNRIMEEPENRHEKEAILNTTGAKHLFGGNSLMYRLWFPKEQLQNKNVILVTSKPGDLTRPLIVSHFRKTGPVNKIVFEKNGRRVGRYYYCLAEGYQLFQTAGTKD